MLQTSKDEGLQGWLPPRPQRPAWKPDANLMWTSCEKKGGIGGNCLWVAANTQGEGGGEGALAREGRQERNRM